MKEQEAAIITCADSCKGMKLDGPGMGIALDTLVQQSKAHGLHAKFQKAEYWTPILELAKGGDSKAFWQIVVFTDTYASPAPVRVAYSFLNPYSGKIPIKFSVYGGHRESCFPLLPLYENDKDINTLSKPCAWSWSGNSRQFKTGGGCRPPSESGGIKPQQPKEKQKKKECTGWWCKVVNAVTSVVSTW